MDPETDVMALLRSGLMTADEVRARVNAVQKRINDLVKCRVLGDRLVDCGDFTLRVVPDWGQS